MNSNRNHSNRLSTIASAIVGAIAVGASASAFASADKGGPTGDSEVSAVVQMDNSYLWAMEEAFNEDYNGDGYIGQPPPPPGGGGGPGM